MVSVSLNLSRPANRQTNPLLPRFDAAINQQGTVLQPQGLTGLIERSTVVRPIVVTPAPTPSDPEPQISNTPLSIILTANGQSVTLSPDLYKKLTKDLGFSDSRIFKIGTSGLANKVTNLMQPDGTKPVTLIKRNSNNDLTYVSFTNYQAYISFANGKTDDQVFEQYSQFTPADLKFIDRFRQIAASSGDKSTIDGGEAAALISELFAFYTDAAQKQRNPNLLTLDLSKLDQDKLKAANISLNALTDLSNLTGNVGFLSPSSFTIQLNPHNKPGFDANDLRNLLINKDRMPYIPFDFSQPQFSPLIDDLLSSAALDTKNGVYAYRADSQVEIVAWMTKFYERFRKSDAPVRRDSQGEIIATSINLNNLDQDKLRQGNVDFTLLKQKWAELGADANGNLTADKLGNSRLSTTNGANAVNGLDLRDIWDIMSYKPGPRPEAGADHMAFVKGYKAFSLNDHFNISAAADTTSGNAFAIDTARDALDFIKGLYALYRDDYTQRPPANIGILYLDQLDLKKLRDANISLPALRDLARQTGDPTGKTLNNGSLLALRHQYDNNGFTQDELWKLYYDKAKAPISAPVASTNPFYVPVVDDFMSFVNAQPDPDNEAGRSANRIDGDKELLSFLAAFYERYRKNDAPPLLRYDNGEPILRGIKFSDLDGQKLKDGGINYQALENKWKEFQKGKNGIVDEDTLTIMELTNFRKIVDTTSGQTITAGGISFVDITDILDVPIRVYPAGNNGAPSSNSNNSVEDAGSTALRIRVPQEVYLPPLIGVVSATRRVMPATIARGTRGVSSVPVVSFKDSNGNNLTSDDDDTVTITLRQAGNVEQSITLPTGIYNALKLSLGANGQNPAMLDTMIFNLFTYPSAELKIFMPPDATENGARVGLVKGRIYVFVDADSYQARKAAGETDAEIFDNPDNMASAA